MKEIDRIKRRHRAAITRDAERALDRLPKADPTEADRLAVRFRF